MIRRIFEPLSHTKPERQVICMEEERRYAKLSEQETQELIQLERDFGEKCKKHIILVAYEEQ